MAGMNVFAFDIETVPDVEGGRRLLGLDGLDDSQVAEAMLATRRAETGGSDFLRLHLHRVAVISVAARIGDRFRVFSIGDADTGEGEIIQRFFDGLERYVPRLVSWNGGGFDLPVLHYRGMIHGVSARQYFETGDGDRTFRFDNYLNRFHERHTDLMDVLAGFQPRANAPLDEMATLCGFPGKMGMSGDQVRARIEAGDYDAVRNYCETDVLNTYLLYLRYELLRARLDQDGYAAACEQVRESLAAEDQPHLNEFLAAWQGA